MSLFNDLSSFFEPVSFSPKGPEDGTSFVITELENEKRKITLTKRSMPYQNVSFGISQRINTTYYQGNATATQQILGPEYEQTTIEGVWKDLYLSERKLFLPESVVKVETDDYLLSQIFGLGSAKYTSAEEIVDLFEQIVTAGTYLKVEYLQQVRYGRILDFTPTYLNAADIAWKMTFEWSGRTDKIPRNAETFQGGNAGFNLFAALQNALAKIGAFLDLVNSYVQAVFSAVNTLRDLVQTAFDLVRFAETLLSMPAALFGQITAIFDDIVKGLSGLYQKLVGEKIGATGAKAEVFEGSVSGADVSPSSKKTAFEVFRKDAAKECARLRVLCLDTVAATEQRFKPKAIQVVTVKEGQTLYDIALQVYGDANQANYLASVNGFSTGVLVPGTRVNIPERPRGANNAIQYTSYTTTRKCCP